MGNDFGNRNETYFSASSGWRPTRFFDIAGTSRTIAFGERPNLTIITARHYSRVEVQADKPRPIVADVAKASWSPVMV